MSYDPRIGKWLQEDPESFGAGDANLTRYVGNNPANLTDPSGLQESSKETKKETEVEKATGVRDAIDKKTLTPINEVHGKEFVAKDCTGVDGCNVAFKFLYAYSGTFVYKGQKLTGLYVKNSVSITGEDPKKKFTTIAALQVLSQYSLEDGKEVIKRPLEDYKRARAGYGKDQDKAKSLGWYVDAHEDAVPPFHPYSVEGDFATLDNQTATIMWDTPGDAGVSDRGKVFYTCVMGHVKGDEWQFIACVKWGYYLNEDKKLVLRPSKPQTLNKLPQEVKDAIERWNTLPGVKKVTIKQ
jgi:hypothetical protein